MTNTQSTRKLILIALLTVVTLGAGGFGAKLLAQGDPKTPPATGDSGAAAGGSSELASAEVDGQHFGLITAAYVGPPELAFEQRDPAGGDLNRAAVSLPVAGDVTISRVDGVSMTYDEFTVSFDDSNGRWSANDRLFQITVEDGFVVSIDEQPKP